jgi:hypothetical protein
MKLADMDRDDMLLKLTRLTELLEELTIIAKRSEKRKPEESKAYAHGILTAVDLVNYGLQTQDWKEEK